MDAVIRRALPADARALTRVAHAAKRHWKYPEDWIRRWRDALTVTRRFVEHHPVYCVVHGARVLGFYGLSGVGPTRELEHFWVARERIGHGIGARMFEHAVATLPPVDAIAPRLGCATTTVFRRLRSFAIPVRPTGPIPRRHIHEIRWDPEVAYAVGLIATDGNLSRDGRHMSVTSKDQDLIETLRRCLRLSNSISRIQNRTGNFYHKVQWCDRRLYDWLLSIGLTPAKSLTLGPLAVPDECFAAFFRG